MSQAESHRPLTAEARVHLLFCPCGIYGEKGCTRTGFLRVFRVFVVSIIPPVLRALLFIHQQSTTIAAVVSAGKVSPSV
jgi:hypothetical protein